MIEYIEFNKESNNIHEILSNIISIDVYNDFSVHPYILLEQELYGRLNYTIDMDKSLTDNIIKLNLPNIHIIDSLLNYNALETICDFDCIRKENALLFNENNRVITTPSIKTTYMQFYFQNTYKTMESYKAKLNNFNPVINIVAPSLSSISVSSNINNSLTFTSNSALVHSNKINNTDTIFGGKFHVNIIGIFNRLIDFNIQKMLKYVVTKYIFDVNNKTVDNLYDMLKEYYYIRNNTYNGFDTILEENRNIILTALGYYSK